jgi:hypothetical protein
VSRHDEVFRPVSALLVLVALALACNADVPRARGTRATHENGLALEYDQRVRAITRLPEGYTLQLAPANARAMNEITVRVQDAPVPGADAWQEQIVGGRTYRFSRERVDGGSGGDEHKLAIVVPVASRWVVLEQHVQAEGAPSFDVAWQVMSTAELR